MSFDVEQIFQAVDVILTQRLQNISYDTTLICTIIDDSNKHQGHYIVTDGTVKFDAYTNDTKYKINDQVRVSVLNGDFSQRKFIEGEYIGDTSGAPVTYISPLDTVLPITGNLIQEKNMGTLLESNINEFCLSTNSTEKYKILWKTSINENSKYRILQSNGIYNIITLKADFLTDLGNLISGNYGLRLDLLVQPEAGSSERIDKVILLDSNEMIGNPYSFEIYSTQEKTITIASTGIITEIILSAYQSVTLDENGNELYSPFINNDGQVIDQKEIWIKNITMGFGNDLTSVENNSLQIYTSDATVYNYNEGNGTDLNNKQIGLIWYNKTANNEYIGFSDGLFDLNYDEIQYRKESYADSRLLAQKGKTGIATDELSLTLAANIEEVFPKMIDAYTALTTNLSQQLQALGRQLVGTAFLDGDEEKGIKSLNKLITAYKKNNETYDAILVQNSNVAKNASLKLVDLYNAILQYGYNYQNSIFPNDWNSEWSHNYYNDFVSAMNSAIYEVQSFMECMNLKTQPKEILSGFRGIYDVYNIRVNREIENINILLDQINIINDDYDKLQSYKDKTNYLPYAEKDLSQFDNKYCIYWYRYKKGYSLTYDTAENADNTEYLYGNFVGNNWIRMTEEIPYSNFGVPRVENEEKEGYYPSRSLEEQLLNIRMEPRREEEMIKVILFYNHQMVESNTLIFTNTEDVPNEYLVDAQDSIRIEHDVQSFEHYQLYSTAYDLVNISDESKMRQLKCYYDGVLSGDETLAEANLYWYIPVNSTMLTYDKKYLIEQGFSTDEDNKTSFSRDGYVYFYKKVNSITEEKVIVDNNGEPILDENGLEMKETIITSNELDRYFTYKIKPYYENSAQNNTIEVYAYIPNIKEPIKGAISFTFSTFGTNGTKYTLAVTPLTTQVAVLPQGNSDFSLRLSLKDANNETLPITDAILLNPEDKIECGESGYNLSIQWDLPSPGDQYALGIKEIVNSNDKEIFIRENANTINSDKFIGIIKSTVTIDLGENKETRPANLIALTPIPYSANSNYYISGPTTIVYNNQGIVSRLSEEPFCLYKHNVENGDSKVEDQNWSLVYYDTEGNKVNNTDISILSYMPILNNDNTLRPAPMYYQYKDEADRNINYIAVAVCRDSSNSVLWSQPIVITQNQYASSTLNDWSGEFEINEANGTIISTMIGAGIKNRNNAFEGVLMGDIERGANFDTNNASGIGLYGFHDGAQSFHFGIDGKAFLGKSGRGRIYFDGTSGQIGSASYFQNRNQNNSIPIYQMDINGKYVLDKNGNKILLGYKYLGTAGMLIDLDDGFIDIVGTTQDSVGLYQNNTTQSHIKINSMNPYFTIHSANQDDPTKYLMFVGDDTYYLQTDNYAKTDFPISDDTQASDGAGFKLDLKEGFIDAYNLKLTSKNLFINSVDNTQPYFIIKNNAGRNLMFVDNNNYYLQSSNFVSKEKDTTGNGKGMKLTLNGGSDSDSSIEAYSFKLRSGDTGTGDHIIVIQDIDPYFLVNTNSGTSSNPETKTLASIGNNNFYFQSADYIDETNNQRGSGMRISISGHEIKAYEGFKLKAYQSNNSNNYILINSTDSDDKAYPLRVSNNFKVSWNGSIIAEGGTFNNITANGGTFNDISVSGTFTSGTIKGATILGGTLDIGGNPTSAGKGNFSVASDGSVTIGGKSIFHVSSSGALTCTSANIGGWNVSSGSSGFSTDNFSVTPLGLSFTGTAGGLTIGADGTTTIENLKVTKTATFTSSCRVRINTAATDNYDLITAGDVWVGGHVGVYTRPDAAYGLSIKGKIKIGGNLLFTGDMYVGSEDASHKGLDQTIIFYNGWKKHTLTFSKGVFIGLDGQFDVDEGGIPALQKDAFLTNNGTALEWKQLGKMAFVDDIKKKFNMTLSGTVADKDHSYYVLDKADGGSYTSIGAEKTGTNLGDPVTACKRGSALYVGTFSSSSPISYNGTVVSTYNGTKHTVKGIKCNNTKYEYGEDVTYYKKGTSYTLYQKGSTQTYATYKKAGNLSVSITQSQDITLEPSTQTTTSIDISATGGTVTIS